MSEIPDDVWERARALRQAVVWSSNGSIEDVAMALLSERMAERERAAKIVALYADHPHEVVAFVADEIAAAIRSPQD